MHCENCQALENLETLRNPFNPHRNLCLCECCMSIPFKFLKDKITRPWWDYLESEQ